MPFQSPENSGFAALEKSLFCDPRKFRARGKSQVRNRTIFDLFSAAWEKRSQVKIRKNRGKSAKIIMGLRTRLPDMKYARVWPDSARGAIMP